MTTIVGVLNKRAVAIAADSAVTVGDTHKVMNTGNKIFSLSKFSPVGIAIYGSASLMDTPWEVIIKCYRRDLGRRNFLFLREYVEDFIQYLRNHEFFCSSNVQKRFLFSQMKTFLEICEENAKARANYATDQAHAVIDELDDCKIKNKTNHEVFTDFNGYGYNDLKKFASVEIEEVLRQSKILDENQHVDAFTESYYHYMKISNIRRNFESGLVFVGYGEEEIYPCLYNVVTTIGFEKRLQFRYGESSEITNENTSASIMPFAQVETTQTVIRGINPTFYEIINNNFTIVLESFKKHISNMARNNNSSTLATQIDNIDVSSISTAFTQTTKSQFFNNYTHPLVTTIGYLGIPDMANVAESLVALTSLVNRMSPREESVGGPVDVAVISKGDGLVWIKRKHYFDPNLNTQFFNNYRND